MDLRHLETFACLAETGSFTAAADRLQMAQPAVSTMVRALETELGVELVRRSPRGNRLTSAGRALLPQARQALRAATSARAAVDATRRNFRGSISVGTIELRRQPMRGMAGLVAGFRETHPDLDVTVRQGGSSGELVRALRAGTLDAAFFCSQPQFEPGLTLRPILTNRLRLVVGTEHPLCGRGIAYASDLAGEAFVDLTPDWSLRTAADRVLRNLGVRRASQYVVDDYEALLGLVRANMAIALLAGPLAEGQDGVHLLDVEGPEEPLQLTMATTVCRPPSPALKRMVDLMLPLVTA